MVSIKGIAEGFPSTEFIVEQEPNSFFMLLSFTQTPHLQLLRTGPTPNPAQNSVEHGNKLRNQAGTDPN